MLPETQWVIDHKFKSQWVHALISICYNKYRAQIKSSRNQEMARIENLFLVNSHWCIHAWNVMFFMNPIQMREKSKILDNNPQIRMVEKSKSW